MAQDGFGRIPRFVTDALPQIGPHAGIVYMVLSDCCDGDRYCRPSLSKLVSRSGFGRATVVAALRRLEQYGFARRSSKPNDRLSYELPMEEPSRSSGSTAEPNAGPLRSSGSVAEPVSQRNRFRSGTDPVSQRNHSGSVAEPPSLQEPDIEPPQEPETRASSNGNGHKPPRPIPEWRTRSFAQFEAAYPKKIVGQSAWKAWLREVKRKEDVPLVAAALKEYKKRCGSDPQFIMDAHRWLRERQWEGTMPGAVVPADLFSGTATTDPFSPAPEPEPHEETPAEYRARVEASIAEGQKLYPNPYLVPND